MKELTPEKKKKMLEAIESGKIVDEKTLALHQIFEDAKDEVDRMESLKQEVIEIVNTAKIEITPKEEDLLNLIKPLIPEIPKTIKGDKGDRGEDGIGINGIDGKNADPVDTALIALEASTIALEQLKPTIPTMEALGMQIPVLGTRIRDGLELLKEEDRLDISSVKGFDTKLKTEVEFLKNWSIEILDQRTQFLINKVSNLSETVNQIGSQDFWDRDPVNGYLYPTNLTDKIGIGTNTPTSALTIQTATSTSVPAILLTTPTNVPTDYQFIGVNNQRAWFGYNGAGTGNAVVQGASGKGIEFNVNNATFGSGQAMVISPAGLVGIGTTAPTHTLTLGSTSTGIAAYNTVDQTTNYERVREYWNSNTFTITSENGGSGTIRPIAFSINSATVTIQNAATATGNGGVLLVDRSGGHTASFGIQGGMTSSSGTQFGAIISNQVSQTSTASYEGLRISPLVSTTGSGPVYLINAGTNSGVNNGGTHTTKFSVDNNGSIYTLGSIGSVGRIGANVASTSSVGASLHLGTNTVFSTSGTFSTSGFGIRQDANTYTSTSSSGTIALTGVNTFATPTLAANSATTLTDASTMYIASAPAAGSNMTITRAHALYVASGQASFLGGIATDAQSTISNFHAVGGQALGLTGNAGGQFAASTQAQFRTLFNANSSASLSTGTVYSNTIIGSAPVTTFTSGTHAMLANLVVNEIGTVTNAGATVTATASLFINNAGSGGASNYSLYVAAGRAAFIGGLQSAGSSTTSNFAVLSSDAVSVSVGTSSLLFGGASGVQVRSWFNGTTSTTLSTGTSYSNTIVGSSPITTFSSGTHSWLSNMVVNPLGTVTSGGATVTNTATLYVGAAGSGGTNNYSLYVNGLITGNSATLYATTTALTNGAAAQVATMTNGPTAGNPTKWAPVNDNGTTRYIPMW